MWMLPLHLHVNQKSDYDDDEWVTLNVNMTPFMINNEINFLNDIQRKFFLRQLNMTEILWTRSFNQTTNKQTK